MNARHSFYDFSVITYEMSKPAYAVAVSDRVVDKSTSLCMLELPFAKIADEPPKDTLLQFATYLTILSMNSRHSLYDISVFTCN